MSTQKTVLNQEIGTRMFVLLKTLAIEITRVIEMKLSGPVEWEPSVF